MTKKSCFYIFISPILFIIIINQSSRFAHSSKQQYFGLIKSSYITSLSTTKCSWKCHDDTEFCKRHHVKLFQVLTPYIDHIYFGIISLLAHTNRYKAANVMILGFLFPFFFYFLLIKSLMLRMQIKKVAYEICEGENEKNVSIDSKRKMQKRPLKNYLNLK